MTSIELIIKETNLFDFVNEVTHESLRVPSTSVEDTSDGYRLYVGECDERAGGDLLVVNLDKRFQYIDHVIERIEPIPDGMLPGDLPGE